MANDEKTDKTELPLIRPDMKVGEGGLYHFFVRFDREFSDDVALKNVQDALREGGAVETVLLDQFKNELGDLSNDGPSAWTVLTGPTAESDPTSVFELDVERSGKPWALHQYMKASKNVAVRFKAALRSLGVHIDAELALSLERVIDTGFDDLVETGAKEIREKADAVQAELDELVEKVRTAYSSAQSMESELEAALPEWAKEGMRGRR